MRLLLAALLGLLAVVVAPAAGAPHAAEGQALRLFGHFGGAASAVALRPPYAYVGVGNSLEVLDIGDPSAPRRVGAAPLPRQVRDLALEGDYAYALGERTVSPTSGPVLMVIDIARPEAPRLAAAFQPDDELGGSLTVAGGYAYLGDGQIRIFDLAEPTAPQELATIGDLAGLRVIETAVVGRFLYAAAGAGGLRVFDVADPREANALGAYTPADPGETIGAVEAAGERLYTLSSSGDAVVLRIFDVSDPGAPRPLGSLAGLAPSTRMAYGTAPGGAAPRIYLASPNVGASARIQVIDVSVPAAPRPLGAEAPAAAFGAPALEPLYSPVSDLAVAPGLVAVAGIDLDLFATTPESAPPPQGSYAPATPVSGLTLSGEELLLETPAMLGATALLPLDVSEPATPLAAGQPTLVGGTGEVLVGDMLYVPEQVDGLGIYARGAGGGFVEVGRLELPRAARGLAVRDATAFVLSEDEGLVAVDVSDPAAPARLDTLPLPGAILQEVVLEGDRAYVSSCKADGYFGFVTIIGLGASGALTPLGAFERICGGTPARIAVAGDALYIHESVCVTFSCTRSLRVVDVANPSAPQERALVDVGFGFASAIVAAPRYVILGASITSRFVLDYSGAITLVEVGDPASPRIVETLALSSEVNDLVLAGPRLFAAGNDGGLSALWVAPLFAPTERVYLPLAR